MRISLFQPHLGVFGGIRRALELGNAAGADPRLIEMSSHGENNPLVPTADNIHEPRNRRVEISVR